MAQLVRDGERGGQAIILDDGARRRPADRAEFGQSERFAVVDGRFAADLLAGQYERRVMVEAGRLLQAAKVLQHVGRRYACWSWSERREGGEREISELVWMCTSVCIRRTLGINAHQHPLTSNVPH